MPNEYSLVHFGKKIRRKMQILRMVYFYFFLNVAFAVEIVGVRKKSIDTTMNPDTAINGKKTARIIVPTIMAAPNCSLRSKAFSSLSAESSARTSGVLIADLIIATNASVAARRFNP